MDTSTPTVVWLNGAINSGKTATAKALQKLMPRTAHVEVDNLNAFIGWMPLNEAIPIDLDNAIAVAGVFVAHQVNVVVSYPLSTACHRRVSERASFPIRIFTLKPPLEICLKDRGQRPLSDWERQRIRYHYGGDLDLEIGVVIDNSTMSSADCAATIVRAIAGTPP